MRTLFVSDITFTELILKRDGDLNFAERPVHLSSHPLLPGVEPEGLPRSCAHHPKIHSHTHVRERSRSVISAASLRLLPEVRVRSSYQMVYLGPCSLCREGKTHLGSGFVLRCCQHFSFLDVAIQRWGGHPNWHTSGRAISVLSYWR